MSTYSRSYTYEDVEEILFGNSRKATTSRDQPPVVAAAAGTSQDSSANVTLQEVSAAPSRRRRLPLWLESCAAEGPAKKSTLREMYTVMVDLEIDIDVVKFRADSTRRSLFA